MSEADARRYNFSFIFASTNVFSLCITKHKVISFVMENRFNSRKNENALAVLPTFPHTYTHKNTTGKRQKGLLMKTI